MVSGMGFFTRPSTHAWLSDSDIATSIKCQVSGVSCMLSWGGRQPGPYGYGRPEVYTTDAPACWTP